MKRIKGLGVCAMTLALAACATDAGSDVVDAGEGSGGAPVGGEGEGAAEALAAAAAASRPPAPSGGVFAHACGALRLGDTVSPLGDGVPAAATARADCGPAGLFA